MIEAWLAGEVPHGVMADWCEEQGLVFPRVQRVGVHRTAAATRSASGSRRVRYYGSVSGSRATRTYVSESRSGRRRPRIGSRRGRWT